MYRCIHIWIHTFHREYTKKARVMPDVNIFLGWLNECGCTWHQQINLYNFNKRDNTE